MTAVAPFRAAVSRDGATILMVRGKWRQSIRAAELSGWIKFYATLRDREKGRFAAFHAEPVAVLKGLEAKVKERSQ